MAKFFGISRERMTIIVIVTLLAFIANADPVYVETILKIYRCLSGHIACP